MATETAPENTVSQDDSATIPSLIVSNFFTGATPLFEKLADLSAFAQVQYSYYASMGVGQPLLGPYEAMGRGFAETEEFAAKYGALTDNFVATAYNDVFGRAPSEAQTAHFQAQVDYFSGIYVEAGLAADLALMLAKGAAIGQMLGEAAINGTATFDYYGAAEAFIAQMDDEDFVPGQPLANFDDAPVVTPPGGGGGGGGAPASDTVEYSFDGGVLVLKSAGSYSATVSGADLRLVEPDGQIRSVELATITKITLVEGGTTLNIAGAAIHNRAIAVDGAGVLNVTGVDFSPAQFSGNPAVDTGFESLINFDKLIEASKLLVESNGRFLVNGEFKDSIKVQWDYWDDKYTAASKINDTASYHNVEINEGQIQLGINYINSIDPEYGGRLSNALLDDVAQIGSGRAQTMHDSILGKVGRASINSREDLNKVEWLGAVQDGYLDRGYISGRVSDVTTAETRKAKVFDFEKGFDRPDYVYKNPDTKIDASGYDGGERMLVGTGIKVDNFNVSRHEGVGVEVALRARLRDSGPDIDPFIVEANGTTHYIVPLGEADARPTWGIPAAWSFDFSVLTGMSGSNKTLSDFDFKMYIDKDASGKTDFEVLTLDNSNLSVPTHWKNSSGVAILTDDDRISGTGSQNSSNFGFSQLKSIIDNNPNASGIQEGYTFGQGQFDIRIIAVDKATNAEVVNTGIVVHVGNYWDIS